MAGVALVQRTTRSVRLTSAGEKLVDDLREPFSRIAQSFFSVRDEAGPCAAVRISAGGVCPRSWCRLSATFCATQVRLQLNVAIGWCRWAAAIRSRHSPQQLPETHVALPLCETRTLLVAAPDYLTRHGTPDARRRAQHNCLYYPRGLESPQWRFRLHSDDSETVQVKIQGNFATNSESTIRCAAGAGHCYAAGLRAPARRWPAARCSRCCRSGRRSMPADRLWWCGLTQRRYRVPSPPLSTGYARALLMGEASAR